MKNILLSAIFVLIIGGVGFYYLRPDRISPTERAEDPVETPALTLEVIVEEKEQFCCETLFKLYPSEGSSGPMNDDFFNLQFELIRSKENVKAAITNYRLSELYKTDADELTKTILAGLSVEQKVGTDLIHVTVRADSSDQAQEISYALMQSYVDRKQLVVQQKREAIIRDLDDKIIKQQQSVESHRQKITEQSTRILTPKEEIEFKKIKGEWEKALELLEKMRTAKLLSRLSAVERPRLVYHQKGWSKKTEKMMQNQRLSPYF